MRGPVLRPGEALSAAIARVLAEPETMRRCARCRRPRPLRLFYWNPHMLDGWSFWCMTCHQEHYREAVA